ncbi:hypothetical protein GHO42_00710 [Pseudomonas sp. FSL R10-0056]|uniref:hypothetical protein n=1 Tax=Pseudomonas TaxID=286 RepID=UPI001294C039|nr:MULTISPECIES: hypothetical protein [Pseudomonas]MQT29963.1 hypothetical protein [Pseudomonas helleri]MQT61635.1 hypothetical protein [Pseudomonas sp. FSL R10-0056]MQT68240.1 hypothetical protein [Pseudomonas sp. FSL R10-0071]MQU47768.1 hypothetical protein [Pseudomonas sp. FSL A6-1183]
MDLDDKHDEVQCPAGKGKGKGKGKAEREDEDREFVLASLDWLTMSDFRAFTAGIRQAA